MSSTDDFDERSAWSLTEPPEGVVSGESVPPESEPGELDRLYEELKQARLRELEAEH
jgi:hypothetical protein